MDGLLDEDTGLVCFCLVPGSDESYKDVPDKSSEDDEDEKDE